MPHVPNSFATLTMHLAHMGGLREGYACLVQQNPRVVYSLHVESSSFPASWRLY